MGSRKHQVRDLFGGRLDRDKGMKRVLGRNPEWSLAAYKIIMDLPAGWEGTGQEIRLRIAAILGEPHHPNAWGPVINTGVRRKWLVRTGRQAQARLRSSHARRNDIYRRMA